MVKKLIHKIPVKIVQITNIRGEKKTGVMLDLSYYLETKKNLDAKVQAFKMLYEDFMGKMEKIQANDGKKHGKRKLSTTNTWKLCKLLSEFNDKIENEFLIVNFKDSYSRDLGISTRYVDLYLLFGKYFDETEVLDAIPLSFYTELCLRKTTLTRLGLFEKEKKWLVNSGKTGTLLHHNQYRKHLVKTIDSITKKMEIKNEN